MRPPAGGYRASGGGTGERCYGTGSPPLRLGSLGKCPAVLEHVVARDESIAADRDVECELAVEGSARGENRDAEGPEDDGLCITVGMAPVVNQRPVAPGE